MKKLIGGHYDMTCATWEDGVPRTLTEHHYFGGKFGSAEPKPPDPSQAFYL